MRRELLIAAAFALGATACGGSTEPVGVPTPVNPPSIIEHYSGTIFKSGSNLHSFKVDNSGEVDVTLTAVTTIAVDADPNANPPVVAVPAAPVTIPLTLTVGQPTLTTLGVQCSNLKQVQATVGSSPQLVGQALAGTFCVSISDPNGVLPAASSYAITVAHP